MTLLSRVVFFVFEIPIYTAGTGELQFPDSTILDLLT